MKLPFLIALTLGVAGIAEAQTVSDHIPSQIQVERLTGSLGASPSNVEPRALPEKALKLIKDFEGWSAVPYDDSAGYCTIGYGHLIALKSCRNANLSAFSTAISEGEGERILTEDTRYARLAVQRSVRVPLSSGEFGSLTSLVFNIGETNFRASRLRGFVNTTNRQLAAREFGRWIKANGRVQNGLVTRRRCESNLFMGQLASGSDGKFNRSQCVTLGISSSSDAPIDVQTGK